MPPPEVVQESNRPGVCPPVPSPLPGPPGPPAPPAPPPPLGAVYKYHGVGSHTSVLKYLYLGNEVTCSTKVTVQGELTVLIICTTKLLHPDWCNYSLYSTRTRAFLSSLKNSFAYMFSPQIALKIMLLSIHIKCICGRPIKDNIWHLPSLLVDES